MNWLLCTLGLRADVSQEIGVELHRLRDNLRTVNAGFEAQFGLAQPVPAAITEGSESDPSTPEKKVRVKK